MSQQAAIRARKRWAIKFRNVAKLGRRIYPKPVARDIASQRLAAQIEREQRMRQRAKSK